MEELRKRTSASQRTRETSTSAATGRTGSRKATVMRVGISKKHIEGDLCRVTFRLPSVAAKGAKSVCIVGDFNDWNIHANPMKKAKNGDYTIRLELKTGKDYQFRYLIDEAKWENDWNADRYVKNLYGDSDNSVVVV
jgi:1,4-alpha-glucan branching enzyme